MRIVLAGKLKDSHWKEAAAEYLKRINRYEKTEFIELSLPKSPGTGNEISVKRKESEKILSALKPGEKIILLDESGIQFSSVSFAKWLEQQMQSRSVQLCFIIGGAFGVDEKVKKKASKIISLSSLTFPHQMVPLILAEQLYRAFTIIRNEPYHHQ